MWASARKQKMGMKGFTLMEVMISVAILGILSSISIPSYQDYVQKSHYSELVKMSAPFKTAVTVCYQITSALANCWGGAKRCTQ